MSHFFHLTLCLRHSGWWLNSIQFYSFMKLFKDLLNYLRTLTCSIGIIKINKILWKPLCSFHFFTLSSCIFIYSFFNVVLLYVEIRLFLLLLVAGTSTRKPRLNSALVAQQAGASGVPNGTNTANPKPPKMSRSKTKHKKYPARLTNVDRSTAQTREVTVNSVTVVITEYKPKQMTSTTSRRESSEQSYSESNDSRS